MPGTLISSRHAELDLTHTRIALSRFRQRGHQPDQHSYAAPSLPPRQRLVLDAAVKDTLGPKTELRFETAPDLVSGVELTVNGHKLAWSIKDYLTSLADHVGEVLEKKAEQSAEPKPAPEMERKTAENATRQLAKHN